MTFSLVACDVERGECGVAVASKFLAIGALVPWVEAGVGAVATQAVMNPSYGPSGLALVRAGSDPAAALRELASSDVGEAERQVGIVDAAGGSATRTGARCLPWAGGRTGPGYAAQGNMLVSEETVNALIAAFEASAGTALADRLLTALAAGQAAGGDRRGQQAAALLVARPGGGYGGSDIAVNLRVDDHPQPIDELRRLFALHEKYFGSTPADRWLVVDDELARELRDLLRRRGYASGDLSEDLMAWAVVENLEERVAAGERIDPVVLAELRRTV